MASSIKINNSLFAGAEQYMNFNTLSIKEECEKEEEDFDVFEETEEYLGNTPDSSYLNAEAFERERLNRCYQMNLQRSNDDFAIEESSTDNEETRRCQKFTYLERKRIFAKKNREREIPRREVFYNEGDSYNHEYYLDDETLFENDPCNSPFSGESSEVLEPLCFIKQTPSRYNIRSKPATPEKAASLRLLIEEYDRLHGRPSILQLVPANRRNTFPFSNEGTVINCQSFDDHRIDYPDREQLKRQPEFY
ncbi:hypothetical protein NCAS_0A03440 [Naumovozyma castellii]|uniref:Uncharacterized protein n=1 Tax=Naumovozyma castellii TaxID=27288 RepID=G0V612_NAUCA|nr:hypothetical protein NCAS_0A03440 [Naumovozyma castellii CBS 4309]CCC66902.1 hypothetical protein NCAS_0A03440 [Naumovozyma castellii CBS 4309]